MSRSLTIGKPTAAEVRKVSQVLSTAETARQRRRADVILLYSAGLSGQDIAAALGVHVNTVYEDLRLFAQHRLACLPMGERPGAPARLSAEQAAEIRRLVEVPPYELGLPYGRWSLNKLATYLVKERVLKQISREHLRRVLKKGAFGSAASSASSLARTRSGRPS